MNSSSVGDLSKYKYEFTEEDWNTFTAVDIDLDTERLVLFEKDDDLLDHSLTLKRYTGYGLIRSFDGDSHRFSFWEGSLPEIRKLYNEYVK